MNKIIRKLGRNIKNGNIPIISAVLKNIQYFINEPYEFYWRHINSKAMAKTSDARIWRMLNRKYRSTICCDNWRERLYSLGVQEKPIFEVDNGKTPVYSLWFQGFENAPDIIKVCADSVRRQFDPDVFEVIQMDEKTLWKYVNIPNCIKHLWNSFSKAHQSDIVRLILLWQMGGVWIDASFYFVHPVPQMLFDQQIFAFQYGDNSIHNKCPINFIIVKPHDEIIGRTLLGLLTYCLRNKKFRFYLMFNYIFSYAIDASENTRKEFQSMPKRLAKINFLLQERLNETYVQDEWEYLKGLTFLFKLSHKMNLEDSEDTYYGHIKSEYNGKQ